MSVFNGQVLDVTGTPVHEGDRIAAAFRIGNVAVLRVGHVLGFAERGNKLTIKVAYEHSSRRNEHDVTGAIEADLNRFVVLPGVDGPTVGTIPATPAVTVA